MAVKLVTEQTKTLTSGRFSDSLAPPSILTKDTTIGELPAHRYQVGVNTVVAQVEKTLRLYPILPGVIVTQHDRMVNVISRRRFFEILGTRYGVAVFLKRPIEIMIRHVEEPLILPGTCLIDEAVHEALRRETILAYEPILVDFQAHGFQLLDIYTLLLAQSQLFATLQQELQTINVDLEDRVARRTEELTRVNSRLYLEVAERKHAEKHLEVRIRYEQAIAQSADALLAAVDQPEVIPETLQLLLQATGVSRVFLSKNVQIEGRGLCLVLTHQVCSPGAQTIPKDLQVLPHNENKEWLDAIWSGQTLLGNSAMIGGSIKQLLTQLGIQSFLLLPVGKPGDWYGLIGLDETAVTHTWKNDDLQLLQTVARMLYTYIERQRSRDALTQAKNEAIRANQFKTELMAKVNHELRTPLGAIMGYTQLLQMGAYGPVAPEQTDPLELILSSTNALSTLVNSLLDQAQLEKGNLALENRPFSVREMAIEVDSKVRILAEKTGLTFKIIIEPSFPEEIVGDRMRIEQIWTNLLSNAIKFTEQGYVRTHIRLQGTGQWLIEVADTGIGIPEEVQASIFDTFVQVDGSATRNRSGAGLGLSIAASIIELMGGTIDLESILGQGTTFTVILPLNMVDND